MKIDFREIFCHFDDLFKGLDAKTNFVTNKNNKPGCKSRLNRSEIIIMIIGYWEASYECLKIIIRSKFGFTINVIFRQSVIASL